MLVDQGAGATRGAAEGAVRSLQLRRVRGRARSLRLYMASTSLIAVSKWVVASNDSDRNTWAGSVPAQPQ